MDVDDDMAIAVDAIQGIVRTRSSIDPIESVDDELYALDGNLGVYVAVLVIHLNKMVVDDSSS